MDGSGSIQQRCFVHAQNSPSTAVHGCTAVEDGSNGLTVSIFPRFLSILPDAVALLLKKTFEIFNKISNEKKQTFENSSGTVALFQVIRRGRSGRRSPV